MHQPGADALRQRHATVATQIGVHDDAIEALGLLHQLQGHVGGGRVFHCHAELAELAVEDLTVQRVVFHHQHTLAAQRIGWRFDGRRRGAGAQGEGEDTTALGACGGGDGAAHRLGQPAGDGEPQPGAAKAPAGRCIGLGETFEQHRNLGRINADAGVGDGAGDLPAASGIIRHWRARQLDANPAGIGELHGVAHQVEQHLAEAPGITDHGTR